MIKLYECEENSIQVQHHQSVQEAKIMKDLCIFEKMEVLTNILLWMQISPSFESNVRTRWGDKCIKIERLRWGGVVN